MSEKKPKRLPVVQKPDPFLHKAMEPVQDPTSPEIQQLIEDMKLTMKKENGIGLAAVQVGVNARVIIIDSKDGAEAFINPEITKMSEEMEEADEGCLSVSDEYGPVKRHTSLTFRSLDREGNEQTHDAHGLFARVVQHEVDHINGTLFVDRMKEQQGEETQAS